jgi:hypothetical protein
MTDIAKLTHPLHHSRPLILLSSNHISYKGIDFSVFTAVNFGSVTEY